MKYEILGKRFCKWYKEEYERGWDEWYGESVPDSLLKELNITKDEYYKTYIYPYLRLKKEHLKITLDILACRLKDILIPQPSPFCLSYKLIISPKINALEWLLVHIADLKYFEFDDFVKSKYEKPYKQCIVCGKPDYYEIETLMGKKQKLYFSHKKKYCHTADCIEDDPNPQEHAKGCHYKEWAYTKKSMNQRLSRLLRRIEKYKKQQAKNNYAEDKLNFKIEETEKEFYKVFEDFYLEQYKKNCEIFYTIRTCEEDEVFDIREF